MEYTNINNQIIQLMNHVDELEEAIHVVNILNQKGGMALNALHTDLREVRQELRDLQNVRAKAIIEDDLRSAA